MVNIFIKSFNRPFYLDRCLQSIENFVEGDFCVKVLDDGTPETYLSKIKEKHPKIEIITSENYQIKIAAIAENLQSGKEIDGFTIPTNLWYKAAKNASDYFMMIEDDVWFTHKINVNDLQEACQKNQISLLKLGWLGNKKDDEFIEISEITEEILRVEPKNLLLFPEFFNDLFFYNKFKFFTILYKLGIVDNATKRKYWALNSILMGFWQKEYWLHIWKNARGKVDEKQQLRNASNYYRKHQDNPNFIARLEKEALKTTFQSSATNSYHKYGDDFDVNYFNHLINQAWLNGSFDEMQNFPKDFSLEYFEKFLNEKIDKTAFRNWVSTFKNQYKNLGCEIE